MFKAALIVSMALTLTVLTGCAVNPVTGKKQFMLLSPTEELQLGAQYAPEIEKQLKGPIDNPTIQNYVSSIGQSIARISHKPDMLFHYTAVNDDSINAMALPGGHIFITKGLLKQLNTESQLAAILAHETVHVTARHSASAMSTQIGIDLILSAVTSEETPQTLMTISRIGTQMLHLSYSRSDEYQADQYALDYLVKAGYNPYALVETMQMLERQNQTRPFEYFSTHPSPKNRQKNLLDHINQKAYPNTGRTNPTQYQKAILNNLTYQ